MLSFEPDAVGGQLHAPTALLPGKSPDTYFTGNWVVRRTSRGGYIEERQPLNTHWASNPRS